MSTNHRVVEPGEPGEPGERVGRAGCWGRAVVGLCMSGVTAACGGGIGSLTQHIEARRLVSELHVQFTKASDAANRAVMADTDEDSSAAARAAEEATQSAAKAVQELEPMLQALGYADERRYLDAFSARFAEYRKLDAEILPLAIENTNLKAQRLSFDSGRAAVGAFRTALAAAAKSAAGAHGCCVDAAVARAAAALLEIEVIESLHIAESEDAAMNRMEGQMMDLDRQAHQALDALRQAAPQATAPLGDAAAALTRFEAINADIVKLSRQNSNVRSLALSLGRKRTVTAQCDEALRELEGALAKHEFRATR
jgi:hypothetical protein